LKVSFPDNFSLSRRDLGDAHRPFFLKKDTNALKPWKMMVGFSDGGLLEAGTTAPKTAKDFLLALPQG
jgi:hypothetical protein